jgi:hypothetical protein
MTPEETRQAFEQALRQAEEAMNTGDMATAHESFWQAHQIGRYRTLLHLRSHFALLRLALRQRHVSEALHQSLLTLLALPLTWARPQMSQTREPL